MLITEFSTGRPLFRFEDMVARHFPAQDCAGLLNTIGHLE